jgi:hypothetical protein
MQRHVMHEEVKYGHFAEYTEIQREMDALFDRLGWRRYTMLVPTVGRGNEVIFTCDYDDMTDFEQAYKAMYATDEFRKLLVRAADLVVQGSVRDELWSTLD